jgi:hypothetical protein
VDFSVLTSISNATAQCQGQFYRLTAAARRPNGLGQNSHRSATRRMHHSSVWLQRYTRRPLWRPDQLRCPAACAVETERQRANAGSITGTLAGSGGASCLDAAWDAAAAADPDPGQRVGGRQGGLAGGRYGGVVRGQCGRRVCVDGGRGGLRDDLGRGGFDVGPWPWPRSIT